MNKYKVIGGIMDGVLTNHEYDILREEKILVYRETKVYNQNASNINE